MSTSHSCKLLAIELSAVPQHGLWKDFALPLVEQMEGTSHRREGMVIALTFFDNDGHVESSHSIICGKVRPAMLNHANEKIWRLASNAEHNLASESASPLRGSYVDLSLEELRSIGFAGAAKIRTKDGALYCIVSVSGLRTSTDEQIACAVALHILTKGTDELVCRFGNDTFVDALAGKLNTLLN